MTDVDLKALGHRLKRLREDRDMRPEQLAAAAQVSASTIYNLQAGKVRSPKLVELVRIAGALGISLAALAPELAERGDEGGLPASSRLRDSFIRLDNGLMHGTMNTADEELVIRTVEALADRYGGEKPTREPRAGGSGGKA